MAARDQVRDMRTASDSEIRTAVTRQAIAWMLAEYAE